MPPAPSAYLTPFAIRAEPAATRINLGPLTTAFALPSHCSRIAITGTNAVRGQTCRVKATATAEDDIGCWPRPTAIPSAAASASSLQGLGFYSPGVMCPTGYISACSQVSAPGNMPQVTGAPVADFGFQFPLVAGERAIGCCPQGYQCAMQGGAQTCHQVATSTKLDAMTCEGVAVKGLDAFQVPFTAEGKTVQSLDVWAPLIQINHQITDLPATSTSAGWNGSTIVVTPTPLTNGTSSMAKIMSATTGSSSGLTSSASSSLGATSSPSLSGSSSSQKILGNVIATALPSGSGASASVSSSSSSISGSSSVSSTSGSASGSSVPSSTATGGPSNAASTGKIASGIQPLPGGATTAAAVPNAPASSIKSAGASSTLLAASPNITNAAEGVQDSSNPDSAPPMPAGAKVGIAFVPIAAAAMIVTYLLYKWHRKSSQKDIEEPEYPSKAPDNGSPPASSPYNADAENWGSNTTVPMSAAAAFAARRNTEEMRYNGESPYNVNNAEMLENGPGPSMHNSVIAPYGYTPASVMYRPDDGMHYYGDERDALFPAPLVPAHFRTISLGTDESVDSPIDGTSPFRLKRGDTLRKNKLASESRLANAETADSPSSSAQSTPTEEGSEWEYNGLARQNSFSRPRPKTGASSIYADDDRESRVLSWNNGSSPMPPMPSPAMLATVIERENEVAPVGAAPALQRNMSFSRPLRAEHDEVKAAVAAIQSGKVTPPSVAGGKVILPPVTEDGVAF
ncbi:hypothetical protein P280DRAFT_481827 [Massarina eburnea CBS 473.64]|uniref:Uncharacterized protein n=1 Tax=Massarina eburnea CBS 473.64 TaxID=1395130 RepID=A0A6A6RUU2_9PLEO|nr:hypothetical protein P280DRAFT_481827 [Massarina eburnea CBS 473.64]